MNRVAVVGFLLGFLMTGAPALAQEAMQTDGMTKETRTMDSMGHDGMQK